MGYRYNPNDQRFYDQLNQMSQAGRRGVDDQRYRDNEKLKNEQAFFQAMQNLPDLYHKRFAQKRERTPLDYGDEIDGQEFGLDQKDKTVHNFDEKAIAPMEVSAPAPVAPVPAFIPDPVPAPAPARESRFGNPNQGMSGGRSYSPNAAAVLDGDAQPGWNPPMGNPPARPAPGSWLNETPYSSPVMSPGHSMNMPMTEEEIAIQEFEKKKEIPAQEVTAASPDPVASISEEAVTKSHKDPRVSFRRFGADEFLRRNAVFQMDLPRIQPTYATMLGSETALAKSGKDPSNRKEWDILKDFETEEGSAAKFNPYTGKVEPLPGVKQREKAGSGRPVEIADENNQPMWVDAKDAIGKRRPNPTVMIPGYDARGNQVTFPVPKYQEPGRKPIPKGPRGIDRPKAEPLPEGLDIGIIGGDDPTPAAPESVGAEGASVAPQRSFLDKMLLSGTAYAGEEEGQLAELRGSREESPFMPVATSPDAPEKPRGLDTSKIKFGKPYLRREGTKDVSRGKPTELPSVKTFDLEGNPIEMRRRVYENGEEEVEFYEVKEKAAASDKKRQEELNERLKNLRENLDRVEKLKSKGESIKDTFGFGAEWGKELRRIGRSVGIGDEEKLANIEVFETVLNNLKMTKLSTLAEGQSRLFDTAVERKLFELTNPQRGTTYKAFEENVNDLENEMRNYVEFLEKELGVKADIPPRKIRVKNSDGEVWDVPENLLEDAKKDGFIPVE